MSNLKNFSLNYDYVLLKVNTWNFSVYKVVKFYLIYLIDNKNNEEFKINWFNIWLLISLVYVFVNIWIIYGNDKYIFRY